MAAVLCLAAVFAVGSGRQVKASEEELYSEVLDEAQEMILNWQEADRDRPMAWGITEICSGQDTETAMRSIGYACVDISRDGVPELLVGALEDSDADIHPASYIVGCYTLKNGRPYPVFEGFFRSRYIYRGEGKFNYKGSGGASRNYEGLYQITEDGTALEGLWMYFTDLEGDCTTEEYVYYYNYTGSWDKEDSEVLDENNTAFWNGVDEAQVTKELINMTPFSER